MSEVKNCPFCGEEINSSATKCRHCGEWLNQEYQILTSVKSELPKEYRKFNWGVFLLGWIWGIGNRTYITFAIFAVNLLYLVPFVGWLAPLAFSIWLGVKGNEFAWKNNNWNNLEQFNRVQYKWAMWGWIVVGISILVGFLFALIIGISTALVEGY